MSTFRSLVSRQGACEVKRTVGNARDCGIYEKTHTRAELSSASQACRQENGTKSIGFKRPALCIDVAVAAPSNI